MTEDCRAWRAVQRWRMECKHPAPVHYTIQKYIAEAITEAMAEEREACAKIADNLANCSGETVAKAIRGRTS